MNDVVKVNVGDRIDLTGYGDADAVLSFRAHFEPFEWQGHRWRMHGVRRGFFRSAVILKREDNDEPYGFDGLSALLQIVGAIEAEAPFQKETPTGRLNALLASRPLV